jgi:hypothetical protein
MLMYSGPDEFRKMLDAFRFFCFQCDGFEIVQTAQMGLGNSTVHFKLHIHTSYIHAFVFYITVGIHTTRKITLEVLSTKLVGFLEFIPFNHFRQLQRLHYKSLYSFDFEDPAEVLAGNKHPKKKTYYFILFGPLSLCNADDEVSVQFFNFDDRDGSLLIWRMQYRMLDEDTDNDIATRTCFRSESSFTISDGILNPSGTAYSTFGVGSMSALKRPFISTDPPVVGTREKTEFFVKAILHHRNSAVFRHLEYVAGEEVFVNYSLADAQV